MQIYRLAAYARCYISKSTSTVYIKFQTDIRYSLLTFDMSGSVFKADRISSMWFKTSAPNFAIQQLLGAL